MYKFNKEYTSCQSVYPAFPRVWEHNICAKAKYCTQSPGIILYHLNLQANRMETELIAQLEQALSDALTGDDGSHDVHHGRRVKQNAFKIAELEGAGNHRILAAAAYLHDLVNVPKNAPNRNQASRLSAQAAAPILKGLGFEDREIAAVRHCIEAHSFSAAIAPTTTEAKILQDADRLESLGALGIARTFYIAGKMSCDLFHGEDPFCTGQRDLDDKRYAIDHFKVKVLGLADTMQTQAGKAIAQERTATMRAFLAALSNEIGAEQHW